MAESTVVACPNCGKKFKISSEKLGRTFKCTGCETRFQAAVEAPAAEMSMEPADSPVAPTPPAPAARPKQPAAAAPKVKRPPAPVTPPPEPEYSESSDSMETDAYTDTNTDVVSEDSAMAQPPMQYSTGASGKPKTSGMAIASLICGIVLCLAPLTSIAAIILGVLGLQKVKQGAGGKGMAITGIVLGAVGILLAVAAAVAVIPLANKARHLIVRAELKAISLSLEGYQRRNAGEYPPDLATLWKNDPSLKGAIFVSPFSSDTPAADPTQLQAGGHLSYLYIYPGAGKHAGPQDVLLYESPAATNGDSTGILLGNGSVETHPTAEAQMLISKSRMPKP
jgi:predicted Zn finger-like uncharacterized protein